MWYVPFIYSVMYISLHLKYSQFVFSAIWLAFSLGLTNVRRYIHLHISGFVMNQQGKKKKKKNGLHHDLNNMFRSLIFLF